MEMQRLCQQLEAFGLDPPEARLYFHLTRHGALGATELAQRAGIHRTEVYRLGDGLVRKGFAEKTLERPVRFVPLGLADVLDKQREAKESRLRDEAKAAQELVAMWPAQAKAWGTGAQRFAVHQGMPQIRALFERMIEHAQEEVVLVMNRRGLARLGVGDTLSRLARKAREGITVRILSKIDAANVAELRQIASHCEVRHVDLSGYHQMLLVDNREIALFVSTGRRQSAAGLEETVVWLNAQDFVMAQKALVDRAWKTGVAHRHMSASLSQQRPAPGMDILRGQWVVTSKVKQMLLRSTQAVLVLPAGTCQSWWAQGLGRVVEGRREAGAQVRVLVHGDRDETAPGSQWVPVGLPFPVVATKEGEALLVRPAPDPQDGEETWALYTSLPDVAAWTWAMADALGQEVLHVPA